MRILITIPLLLLISFSGMRLSVAYHFCSGEQVSARISLSDKLASCGMEDGEQGIPFGTTLTSHCCENVLSVYTLGNNYLPSTHENDFTTLNTIDHQIPGALSANIIDKSFLFSQYNIRPPGSCNLNADIQPVLCVFRI